jgi:transposase
MTRKRRPYKTYPKEFKLEALRLMESSDRPASEVAMQLVKPGSEHSFR